MPSMRSTLASAGMRHPRVEKMVEKIGGLGDFSASLPRILGQHCDVRVLIPGYRSVLRSLPSLPIVGELEGLADIPPCTVAAIRLTDGLVVYVLVRRAHGQKLTARVVAPDEQVFPDLAHYRRILVPMKLGIIGEEMLATAVKLASEHGAVL